MKTVICESTVEAGAKAADLASSLIRKAIEERGRANLIMATGVSQFDMLDRLIEAPGIDWTRVAGFHLDEYAGIDADHPASFRHYLKERFVDRLPRPIGEFYYINGDSDAEAELKRLTDAIAEHPIDLCFLGMGRNGHIAFNEPPADFETRQAFRMVTLDDISRKQQLDQGWFPTLDAVPRYAISMTVPQIMKSHTLVCTVTGGEKSTAVEKAVNGPVTPDMPASILQRHADVHLFLDVDAARLIR